MPETAVQISAKQAFVANAAMLQERARIARELHDGVAQTLYAISVTASRARSLLDHNEHSHVQHIIEDVLQLANSGQSELRAVLTNMRSERFTAGGLTAGLASLVGDIQTRNGLNIRLSVADEPDVPAATKEALFLITREALHNVVLHASADRVDIVLDAFDAGLILQITDNGRGFDPTTPRPGHFGLQSMRERAAALGGTVDVFSAPVGTRLRVYVPASRAT